MCYCLISFHLSCHLPLPLSPYLHLSMPGKRAAVGQADVSLFLSLSFFIFLSLSLSLFLSRSLAPGEFPRGPVISSSPLIPHSRVLTLTQRCVCVFVCVCVCVCVCV